MREYSRPMNQNPQNPKKKGGATISGKANLGQNIEQMLDMSCQQYFDRGIACIQKVPTPFKIVGTSGKLLLVVPSKKSTVDYLGEFQGVPFAMEAKSSQNKTYYPVDPFNREAHQREFLSRWNGKKYFFIAFETLNENYLVPYSEMPSEQKIPIDWFRTNLPNIKSRNGIILDFLGAAS